MSDFLNAFATIYAQLAISDIETGTARADEFVYTVRDWIGGTPPETDDPLFTLALLAIEPEVNKWKERK